MAHVIASTAPLSVATPRRRVRALLAWLHLWVGLSVGLVFAVVGLSGSALVFHDELVRAMHPAVATQVPRADPQVLERIMAAAESEGLRSLQLPSPTMPTWVGFHSGGRRVHYATDDGRVLADRSADTDLLLWLHELHTHLLAGEAGEAFLGVTGFVSLSLVLIGLYLWWPRRDRMFAQLRVHAGPPVRRWLTWHRSSGVLLLPLLLLSLFTGIGMVYHDGSRALLTGSFGGLARPPAPPVRPEAEPQWGRILASAQAALPDGRLTRIALPDRGTVVLRARETREWHPNGRSTVAVDTSGGAALRVYHASRQPMGSRAADAIYPLHIGAAGGMPMRLATFVAGLLPAFLLVTGFLFWRRRTAGRRRQHPG